VGQAAQQVDIFDDGAEARKALGRVTLADDDRCLELSAQRDSVGRRAGG
jgi:hypothetical protein